MTPFGPGWWVDYGWYLALLAGTGAERFLEVAISARNLRWALANGGREEGRGHFPAMVVLHTGLVLACALEPVLAPRPFLPALGIPAVVLVLAAQGLRYWCILTLGHRWNTRIVVVPGLPLVRRGPYRFLPHPNYVVVAVEGIALPLVFTGWVTALAFTVLNAVLLLGFRIPAEEAAMSRALAEARP
ncbi:MAG: isoprenylcysteine carboxyl methyltransferase family protein [Amnibacterium sp.]